MVKLLVKKIRLFGGNIIYLSKNGTPSLFVKTFGMTSEISVRGMVGLTLVRKDFKCFNFYSIDIDFVVVQYVFSWWQPRKQLFTLRLMGHQGNTISWRLSAIKESFYHGSWNIFSLHIKFLGCSNCQENYWPQRKLNFLGSLFLTHFAWQLAAAISLPVLVHSLGHV